jgi:regulator of RNase E activity RraA
VARAAKLRGVAALVVDGPVTDAVELADIGLPIWCRGLSGQTTRRLALGGRRNCPVAVGGAVVEAGDAVLCDGDGVMAISPGQLDEALAFADKHMKRETFLVEGLERGKSLASLIGAGVAASSNAADRASAVPPAAF